MIDSGVLPGVRGWRVCVCVYHVCLGARKESEKGSRSALRKHQEMIGLAAESW